MGQIDTVQIPVKIPASTRNLSKEFTDRIFKPGQSGNPSGRPPKPLTERLLARLAKEDENLAERLVQALINRAEDEDPKVAGPAVKAITEIFDRVEGKVEQKVDLKAGVYQTVDDVQLDQRLQALLSKRDAVECQAVSVETPVAALEAGGNTDEPKL